jgi:hypothetical protein
VSAEERFCANCGARMPDPDSSDPGLAVPRPGSDSPAFGTPASSSQPGTPKPPASADQPQLHLPQGAASTTPPRKGLPVWLIVVLSVVGLCAVICIGVTLTLSIVGDQVSSVFSTVVSTIESDPNGGGGIVPVTPDIDIPTIAALPTLEPLPTLPSLATLPPIATSESGGGITGGGIPGGAAGGDEAVPLQTQQAEAAIEATAVAATAEAEALFANATQVFRDEFVDNRNNWFTGVFQEIETDLIEDGVFKVIWAADGSSYELYEVRDFNSFIVQVDCLIYRGGLDGSCGLVFGQQNDIGFYKYEMFDNYYRLFYTSPDAEPTLLLEGEPTGVIRPGEPNQLRVARQGPRIILYLNDVRLAETSDSTYLNGKIGISTNSYLEEGGIEIWFDNFTIWELPN